MTKTIMTADDSASVRQCVRIALTDAGYNVIEAVDGQDALDKFQATTPDMLLFDVNMPNVDGIEAIRRVRQTPSGKFIPALLLTTESDESMKQKGRQAGATGWLVKPFNKDKLVAVVKKVLG